MKVLYRVTTLFIAVSVILFTGCSRSEKKTSAATAEHSEVTGEHDGHNHEMHEAAAEGEHAGHDHDGEAGEHDRGEVGEVDEDHDHELHDAAGEDEHDGPDHDEDGEGDGHEDHEHEGAEAELDDGDEHGDLDAQGHAGHDHTGPIGGSGVTLDKNAQEIAGIKLDSVQKRVLTRTIELPGRIGFDEDRLVHITPRYGGVIREVNVNVGARVEKNTQLAVMENNMTLASYTVRAPISGTIIEKHAALGESVGDDRDIFVLADLSRVWVNCDVYTSDIDLLKPGMKASVSTIGKELQAEGSVGYIAPVFNQSSSTGLLRIELVNSGRKWRPGMFVRASVKTVFPDSAITVGNDAIQVVDGENVVFVPGPANSFFSRVVRTGRRSESYTEITGGINQGEMYVSSGAFELKATLVTSGMDPHAGHGH